MSQRIISRTLSSSSTTTPFKLHKLFSSNYSFGVQTPSALTQTFKSHYSTFPNNDSNEKANDSNEKAEATTKTTSSTTTDTDPTKKPPKRLHYRKNGIPLSWGDDKPVKEEFEYWKGIFEANNLDGELNDLKGVIPDMDKEVKKMLKAQEVDYGKIISINKQDLEKTIAGKGNYLLVDVRSPAEVQTTGLIPTAVNIPIVDVVSFEDAKWKTWRKYDEIIFYCKSGRRSRMAAEMASHARLKSVKNYKGSSDDWFGTPSTTKVKDEKENPHGSEKKW